MSWLTLSGRRPGARDTMQPMQKVNLEAAIDRDLGRNWADLPPAFEASATVHQVEEILRSFSRRSPVLSGPPGVGKTAILGEIVRRAHQGVGIPLLARARVVQISLRTISSRFKDRSEATVYFGQLATTLASAPGPVIPYFRDIHLAYELDWEPILIRLLTDLETPILAEAPPRELDLLLENWTELADLLVPIPVEEPRNEQLGRLLAAWAEYAAPGRITTAAQRSAIELTARFMGDRPFPRKALDLLRQTVEINPSSSEPIGVREVVQRFSQLTRVPARLVDPGEPLDLSEVHQFVASRLLGQDEAVDAVVRMMALIKAGMADLRRPFGTFLFVGPTGVGKTHNAQLLAEYLFGDRNRLIRINMADYGSENGQALLFGNPYAHHVKDQRGVIATRLQGHPFGVLLLDELEKATASVHDSLLQLIDEGRFINGRGETVSGTSLIVIATSNAGAEVFRHAGLGFEVGRNRREIDIEIDRRLSKLFRFEFLNRFDRIVHFHPLSREDTRRIAERELADLIRRDGLVSRQLHVEVDPEVLDWLVAHGHHPHYGARFLRREIERSAAATLAEWVVRENPPPETHLSLGVRRDRLVVRVQSLATPAKRPGKASHKTTLATAASWLERWEPLLAETAARRAEASTLIDASAKAGFWENAEAAQATLRRYAALDARVEAERRIAASVERLRWALERDESVAIEAAMPEVVDGWRRWHELGSEPTSLGAWLVIGPGDPLRGSPSWIGELADMYVSWLARNGLTGTPVAEEVLHGEIVRLVLDISGPGALALLEMEQGEHRRRGEAGLERAFVQVVGQRATRADPPWPHAEIKDARQGPGKRIERRQAKLTLTWPDRGVRVELHGTSTEVLELVSRDLGPALAAEQAEPAIARTYGLRGGGAWDPRTNAAVPAVKDVLRGHLEAFRLAWEAAP